MDQLRRIDRARTRADESSGLAVAATRSSESKGRERPEPPDPLRTAFERDRDRIVHSNAIRRLAHKTQVFIAPDNDHFVTRLTILCRWPRWGGRCGGPRLNETLTEAICLGHDIGQLPLRPHRGGRPGRDLEGGWIHSHHSVRVLSVLEPLNLSWETLDGIRAHPWKVEPPPATPEGALCRFADRIAYLSHDLIDAMRGRDHPV